MAMSQSANLLEKAMGHGDNAVIEQNVTNPARDLEKYGDPSGEKMLALAWMGKNDVQVGGSILQYSHLPFSPFQISPWLANFNRLP